MAIKCKLFIVLLDFDLCFLAAFQNSREFQQAAIIHCKKIWQGLEIILLLHNYTFI